MFLFVAKEASGSISLLKLNHVIGQIVHILHKINIYNIYVSVEYSVQDWGVKITEAKLMSVLKTTHSEVGKTTK